MKGRAGFSLIELIMIIALGSVLVSGLVVYGRSQFENATRVRDFLVAANLARMRMADLDRVPYASLPAVGNTTYPADPSFPGFETQVRVTAVLTSGTEVLRQYEVRVDYEGGTFASPLMQLFSYRQSTVIFGDGV